MVEHAVGTQSDVMCDGSSSVRIRPVDKWRSSKSDRFGSDTMTLEPGDDVELASAKRTSF